MGTVELLREMGFSEDQIATAISATGNSETQEVMEWLFAHHEELQQQSTAQSDHAVLETADDKMTLPADGNDQEVASTTTSNDSVVADASSSGTSTDDAARGLESSNDVAKSLKCDVCGKVLRNVEDAELHAARTQHASFSESTEEKKPLTEEEKRIQKIKLEERMAEKKLAREALEKREQKERERLRRAQGKDMTLAKAKFDELEIKKIAEMRKREKEDDRRARQKIKDEIEKDKRERAAKKEGVAVISNPSPDLVTPQPPVASSSSVNADSCRLQIRLPGSGRAIAPPVFRSKETLSAVRTWLLVNHSEEVEQFEPLTFATTYPKRLFTEEDMKKSLSMLGMVPSAVLVARRLH